MNNDSNNNLNEQSNELQVNQDAVVAQPQINNEESVSPAVVAQPQINNDENVSPASVEQSNVQPSIQENTEQQVPSQVDNSVSNTQPDVQNSVSNDLGSPKKSSNKLVLIIVAVLVVAAIIVAVVFVFNKPSSDSKSNSKDTTKDTSNDTVSLDDAKLLEDAKFNGYGCLNSKCTLSVDDGNDFVEYEYTKKKGSKDDEDILLAIDDYEEYVKVNIYYIEKGNTKTIVDYKIISKNTGEELKNIKTEEELRNALGLFPVGVNNSNLTLLEIGEVEEWFSVDDDDNSTSYTLIEYKFADSNDITYTMQYKNPTEEAKNLVVGNVYSVEFEVVNEISSYEYNIISIK